MLAAALSLALLPSLCSAVTHAQVYLHPPLSSSPRPAATAEASALLAHHLRLEAFSPSVTSNHREILLGNSQAFVGDNARDALVLSLDASRPEDVIPDRLHPALSLSGASTSPKSLIEHYFQLAESHYHTVFVTPPKAPPHPLPKFLDIFSLSSYSPSKSGTLEKFLGNLSAIVLFVEGQNEGGDRFGAFHLPELLELEQEWGHDSEVYQTAAASVKAAIMSAASSDALSLAVILSQPSSSELRARQPPQSPLPDPQPGVPPTAPIFSTSTCFTTASECGNATASCSSRGQCIGVARAGRTCFVCDCGKAPLVEGGKNVSWAGSMCQKQDLSQQFSLIAGVVVFLALTAFGSVALLYGVGSQELPGTLTGGVVNPKRD